MILFDVQNKHKKLTFILLGVFVLLLVLNALQDATNKTQKGGNSSEPLFDALNSTPQAIKIELSPGSYELQFSETGWIVPSAANFPADDVKVATLLDVLAQSRKLAPSTRLEARHDRLGLTDPREGGQAARLSFQDQEDASMLVSVYKGQTFARAPDEVQSWLSDRPFPPLQDLTYWLDLGALELPLDKDVSSVKIQTNDGEFMRYAEPPNGVEQLLYYAHRQVRILNVQDEIEAAPTVTHTIHFSDNTDLTIQAFSLNGQVWAKFSGTALKRPDLSKNRMFQLDAFTSSDLFP